MKWSQVKLAVRCKRNGIVDLEIVVSREFFSVLDENGKELSNLCDSRTRFCVRRKGNQKPEKCFPTFEKAKEFLNELVEAAKPKDKNKIKK